MLKIKLQTRGKKHQRTYRIIVAETRTKLDGKFTDDLGHYNPFTKEMVLDKDKMKQWIKNGAQLTLGVKRLLEPDKYPKKKIDRTKRTNKEDLIESAQIDQKTETKPTKSKTKTKK